LKIIWQKKTAPADLAGAVGMDVFEFIQSCRQRLTPEIMSRSG